MGFGEWRCSGRAQTVVLTCGARVRQWWRDGGRPATWKTWGRALAAKGDEEEGCLGFGGHGHKRGHGHRGYLCPDRARMTKRHRLGLCMEAICRCEDGAKRGERERNRTPGTTHGGACVGEVRLEEDMRKALAWHDVLVAFASARGGRGRRRRAGLGQGGSPQ